MKRIVSLCLTAALCIIAMTSFSDNTKDDAGHSLVSLWKTYYRAGDGDRPRDMLDALDRIKKEAADKRLPWDFYDACDKYVSVRVRTNWKLMETAAEQRRNEIEEFGDPVASFFLMKNGNSRSEDLSAFVTANSGVLKGSFNPGFYRNDRSIQSVLYSKALLELLDNDYDYALWSIFLEGSSDSAGLHAEFDGTYPMGALLEYSEIMRKSRDERIGALKGFAAKNSGNAASLLARQELLSSEFSALNGRGAASGDYVALRKECDDFISDSRKFSGVDETIAGCCRIPASLIEQMDSKSVRVKISEGKLDAVLKNLTSVDVKLSADGSKSAVFSARMVNDRRSYYVPDTLELTLPENLDDGTYQVKCSNGDVLDEVEYDKYTLSIATRRDSRGYGVYVTDYKTGEPVSMCDITLSDWEGKVLAAVKDLKIDGFAYLPEQMASKMADGLWSNRLQASIRQNGRIRLSSKHIIYRHFTGDEDDDRNFRCDLFTDRGAYNPGDTCHFKAVLYQGTYAFNVCPGIKVTATLTNEDGDEAGSCEMVSNEFGSVSGSFELKKGQRGGYYELEIEGDEDFYACRPIRVDEFVLPTFSLEWEKDDRLYLPGDSVSVRGRVKSYSGHALATAKAVYSVTRYGSQAAAGEAVLAQDGCFEIGFTPENGSAAYNVNIVVSDGTGESLEFNRSVYVSDGTSLLLELVNGAEGRFQSPDGPSPVPMYGRSVSKGIISSDEACVRFNFDGLTYPGLKISYKLYSGETVLSSGTAREGDEVRLDLAGRPAGQYRVEAAAVVKSETGKEYTSEAALLIVKAGDGDTGIDMDVEAFFKNAGGDDIAVQFGSTTGPVWAVVELYGTGNVLLEHKTVRLAGKRGKEGSLHTVRYAYRDTYPDAVSLNIFWFKNGEKFQYSRKINNLNRRELLPLGFSRFLDTTSPAHEYTFNISTGKDVECVATIFDISTEYFERNVWRTTMPILRQGPDVSYDSTPGTDHAESYEKGLRYSLSGKAAGVNGLDRLVGSTAVVGYGISGDAVLEEMVVASGSAALEDTDGDARIPESVRENFANTIAWEPELRSDDEGNISFTFRTADKLSRYAVQLFAHDKGYRNSVLRKEMVVTIPVKIAVVQPQHLYESDRYVARVTLSNNLDRAVAGKLSVRFFDGTDYRDSDALEVRSGRISVDAGSSAAFSAEIKAPEVNDLGMLAVFEPDDREMGSDAVFVSIPVHPAMQTIIEAHSSLLISGADREALVAGLRGAFVNVEGGKAALREISIKEMLGEAVPECVEPASENTIALTKAAYSRFLLRAMKHGEIPVEMSDAELAEKIRAGRNTDGGYAWFKGMRSSPVVTQVVLERNVKAGFLSDEEEAAAVGYLDALISAKDEYPVLCGGISPAQYLYVRSMYPSVPFITKGMAAKDLRLFKKSVKEYLTPSGARGFDGMVLQKARRLRTLRNLSLSSDGEALAKLWGVKVSGLSKSIAGDVASLSQYAEAHRSGGCYYPNAVMPFRGLLESELYAHSLLCDLMSECGNKEIADGIRLWIMVQKETQQWDDDPAYLEALGSVFAADDDLLSTKVVTLSASFTKPFGEIAAAGNGFTIERHYYLGDKEIEEGQELHIGDRITARYNVWSEENRSFVKLTAPRCAALRPVDQLSGHYGWRPRPLTIDGWYHVTPQGYRSVLSDRTEFWFDVYPEEKTTISEDFLVTQEGTFSSPVASIESIYAAHYRANDGGDAPVTVVPN